mmetsp:Transcript_106508/g.243868  ORF Transcript_106508/g.243868 Transcript_106508/m.243868 type:complete len:217 (-) Transcript_106508:1148-1798(-)
MALMVFCSSCFGNDPALFDTCTSTTMLVSSNRTTALYSSIPMAGYTHRRRYRCTTSGNTPSSRAIMAIGPSRSSTVPLVSDRTTSVRLVGAGPATARSGTPSVSAARASAAKAAWLVTAEALRCKSRIWVRSTDSMEAPVLVTIASDRCTAYSSALKFVATVGTSQLTTLTYANTNKLERYTGISAGFPGAARGFAACSGADPPVPPPDRSCFLRA